MPAYLLDTSVLIDYLRGKKETVTLLTKLFQEGSSLGFSPINIIEVLAGMKEHEEKITRSFLDSLEYYELTKDIADQAGEYKRTHQKKGIVLSVPDVAIAATAIIYNLTLITGNPKHYPMPELNIITHKAA